MQPRLRAFVVPAYLLLCLMFGGSVQGIWRVMLLQLVAVGLIGWALLAPERERLTRRSKRLLALAAAILLLFVVQLLPLPPGLWSRLPGRDLLVEGYVSLGLELPWIAISLAPYATLATALTLFPPLAAFLAVVRLNAVDETWLAITLILGALLCVLLGAVQTLGGFGPQASGYLYEITNTGAVGFFANANHMGTLLLATIPFAAALIAAGKIAGRGPLPVLVAFGAAGLLIALVGLALNRSLAAIGLAMPVILVSALLLPGQWRGRRFAFAGAALLTVIAVLLYTSSPLRQELAGADMASLESRLPMWALSWEIIRETFPFGTGFGTFELVFRAHENPAATTATYVNHAHSDYVELLVEGGLAALLLVGAFLAWWGRRALRIWRSPLSGPFARAAIIATAAILAHSLVDYPLRTAAISALFATCLGVMARPARRLRSDDLTDVRPTRHLVIG